MAIARAVRSGWRACPGRRSGVAGHLQADVEALMHVQILLHLGKGGLAGVDGAGDTDPLCEGAAEGVGSEMTTWRAPRGGQRRQP